MTPPDSLQLDEHLARLLAAYDQGLGEADDKAPTLGVSRLFPEGTDPPPGEQAVDPVPAGPVNEGSAGDLLPDPSPPAPTPVPQGPSHRVGRFELRRQLGKGGCGIVFLAFDPKLQREVALKIPRPEMLLSPDARKRLVREALAAAEFNHPNLVPVYETGEIGPVCFIATAFCPGQTLAEWLDRQVFPVPVRQAARLVAVLAEAVQHAHDRGVLHRDLKPNNVILQEVQSDDGHDPGSPPGSCLLRGDQFIPRVVDFGLAKLAERGPSETGTRQILGTPKYMAPEQAQARHDDVGPPADVYALGVILYELLAGRPPYDGATDVEVLRQAIEGNLTHPRSLRKDIPRDLEAICLKAMARSPARRYRTAIDLADDLRRFLDGRPTLARPLNSVGRAARWLRRNDQLVALIVVTTVAFVLLTAGLWYFDQNRRLEDEKRARQVHELVQNHLAQQRSYADYVRSAFLYARAGDARQMEDALATAATVSRLLQEPPCFAWGYLKGLGRVARVSITAPEGAPATALAIAPDGSRVLTGHPGGLIALWDRASGKLLGSVKHAHSGDVTQAVFLAGGTRLVTAAGEPAARAWAVDAGGGLTPTQALPTLGGPIVSLATPSDGSAVIAGSANGDCLRWDPTGVRPSITWRVTDGEPVAALAVSSDGRVVATAGRTGSVRLWEAATGAPAGELRSATGALAVAFVPSARGWLLAAGFEDGTIRLFDSKGREARTLAGHAEPVLSLAVSPDGSTLASSGMDESVCVWDIPTGVLRALLRGHDRPVRGVRFGPDSRTLVTASDDGLAKVWDLTDDPEGPAVRDLPAAVTAIAAHPDGRQFAVAFADGSVQVYSDRGAPPRMVPANGRGVVTALQFPETGPPVGAELTGRAVVCWAFGDSPRAVLRAEPPGGATPTTADLSDAAGHLAVGDDRGRVTVWSLPDSAPTAVFETGLTTPVRFLAISSDGSVVAAQTSGPAVGVWRVGESGERHRVFGHGDGLWLLRFTPAGDRVVTAGRGSSIKVWNLADGREECSMLGHVGRVTGLAVSADGRTLASGSRTGEVKLWCMRTGLELVGLRRHTGQVTATEFSADGRLLLTAGVAAGGRGELAFWEAVKEE
jgi:WD40 repeat protein/serine/threonine protein kinase